MRKGSLREGLIEIDKLCERLMLPKSIRAETSMLYRKIKAEKLTAGRATWSVIAALIFIICRRRRRGCLERSEKS